VGALRKRGDAEPPEGIPWGSGFRFLRKSEEKEREGHEEGRGFFEYPVEANLGGAKAQEGKDLDSLFNHWECRECRWFRERKPLKRRC
jgi:hypothetical protein